MMQEKERKEVDRADPRVWGGIKDIVGNKKNIMVVRGGRVKG